MKTRSTVHNKQHLFLFIYDEFVKRSVEQAHLLIYMLSVWFPMLSWSML